MRGGELKASDIVGPIDLDSNGADVTLEKLEKSTGMLRVKAWRVRFAQRHADGGADRRRNADVDVIIDRPAPLAIYGEEAGRSRSHRRPAGISSTPSHPTPTSRCPSTLRVPAGARSIAPRAR